MGSRALLLALLVVFAAAQASADVSFSREIAPIILRRCVGCHGERANAGGYRAHTFASLRRPGASGAPAIVPGKPEASRLYQLITARAEQVRMPKSDDALAPAQTDAIRRWILEGARFDGTDASAQLKSLLGARMHPAAPAVYRAGVPVLALALFPGGSQVAVGGYNEVTVWDASSGTLVRRIGGLPQRIHAIEFSRDGRTLLLGGGTPGEYGEVCLVDVERGVRTTVLDTWGDICLCASFSKDGQRVAAGAADNSVRVYEVPTKKRVWSSGVHADWVTSVSFSGDGKFVASASRDMTVKVNDAATGELFTTYSGHNRQIGQFAEHAPVYAVRFGEGGADALSAGAGAWLQRWDPVKAKAESGDAGDMEDRFSKQSHAVHMPHGFAHEVLALVRRGGQVFASSADGAVKQFDGTALKEMRSYKAGPEWLFAVDYDPASGRVAAGSYAGHVYVWDATTGMPVVDFQAQPGSAGAGVQARKRGP